MANKMDGICFKNMVDYAVRNLHKHVKLVNQLNVFPVPDGDTGTNMVTTIQKGLSAVNESIIDLSSFSQKFARSIVYEARGNSGVIVSQFLKGIAERFYDVHVADGALLIEALEKGRQYAYSAVATPVEGTMLTVIKDATDAVKHEFTGSQGVHEIINSFVDHAKISLEKTPELLSVLRESGVVDSGGAGIVYLFEGMKKYLDGESLDVAESHVKTEGVDYDSFHRNSRFEYGYCTELLLQLLNTKADFEEEAFKNTLFTLGDSLVISVENDKVRIHIHTKTPENVFALCHKYGEFLSCKIENMTVQHAEQNKRIVRSSETNNEHFSIVAVAYDSKAQEMFLNMGADVVIRSDENLSTKDYLSAFAMCETDSILVFPNSSDAVLSAKQAGELYRKAEVTVLNTKSIAECYAALPTVDFSESDVSVVCRSINDILRNLHLVSIDQRKDTLRYHDKEIHRNEYYSFSGKDLIAINSTLREVCVQTIKRVCARLRSEIITIFYPSQVDPNIIEEVTEEIKTFDMDVEVFTVSIEKLPFLITISFE